MTPNGEKNTYNNATDVRKDIREELIDHVLKMTATELEELAEMVGKYLKI